MNKTDEALKLAKECGATTYTNRHYPEATAVTFSPLAWEKFCEQALAAPVQPVAWADAYAISNLPAVDEAIRALLDDKTADNATAVVQAILGAVPPEQPAPVQETCRECAGEGIQGEGGDGFVSGVTWRCDSCNGTGKSTPPAAPVQVDAWPCVIAEADFEQDTITLKMQCSDYKVGAGQHWLHTTQPAAQPAPMQEPVAQSLIKALTHAVEIAEAKRPGTWDDLLQYRVLLNTPPAQRQWVGLTDEDAHLLANEHLHYQTEGYEVSGIYDSPEPSKPNSRRKTHD